MVVGETDYQGFAILYLERARQLSVKLYGIRTSLIPTAKNTCPRHWQAPEPSLEPEI